MVNIMKYMNQLGIVLTVCVVAEVLYMILGLPIPASVYGLVIMLLLLMLKIVKLEQVEGIGGFLLGIMPILFIAPTVGIMETVGGIGNQLVFLIIIAFVSTLVTITVTGAVAQLFIRTRERRTGGKDE
ncbi:MAG: CidA/LrgA family protein [Eubacteriales bacterium]